MRLFLVMCLVLATELSFAQPSHAEYRLNCRLMDTHDPHFKRWCLGEVEQRRYLVRQCGIQGLCTIRVQNFKSAYSKNMATNKVVAPESIGAGIGGTALSAAANGTVSDVSASVRGVTTETGGLIGRTLSTVGF
jgi:hypothetical protein